MTDKNLIGMVKGLLKRSRSAGGPQLFRLKETNLVASHDDTTGSEALVHKPRDQSYTDLWLSALDTSPESRYARLAEAAAVAGGKNHTAVGAKRTSGSTDLSFTDVWMKSLSPPLEVAPPVPGESDRLREGEELKNGTYKILFQVDRPGYGSSYLASHQVLDAEGKLVKKVAVVKRYHLIQEAEDMPSNADRFMKYAKYVGAIDHPNVVPLFDSFIERGYGYVVHQYIEGFSLKKQVRQLGPLDEKVAIGLLLQMSDLVGYFHEQASPVVHIDMTPDILQMWRGNTLKLTDIGPDPCRNIFVARAGKGYLKYIAPERADAKPNVRSNMYSMGATLFFMITGRSPAKGVEALHPRAYNKRISQQMDTIVARLTATDPKERYSSIAELKECAFMAQLFYGTK